MYKELLDALKTKFSGVSDNILGRVATRLAKTATTADQVRTAVDGVTFQQVLESYGDSRATEATQTAVQNYEAKYGLKEGQKIDTAGGQPVMPQTPPQPAPTHQPNGGTEQTPAWAQTLIDANKALSDRLTKMEGERTANSRKQQLSTIVAKLPENLRKPYERTHVDGLTDEQFSSLLTDITTEVDGIASSIQQKGAIFGRPAASSGATQGDVLTKEQEAAIAHRESNPAAEGQPF